MRKSQGIRNGRRSYDLIHRPLPFLVNALESAYQLRMREKRAAAKSQVTAA